MLSCTEPGFIMASTVTSPRICTMMFSWTNLLKPGDSTVRV